MEIEEDKEESIQPSKPSYKGKGDGTHVHLLSTLAQDGVQGQYSLLSVCNCIRLKSVVNDILRAVHIAKEKSKDNGKWEVVKSMLEELEKANDLDDIWAFIESIAAVNQSMKKNQDELRGLRHYCNAVNEDKNDGKQLAELIRYIANLALRSEHLFTKKGIRILRKNSSGFLYYTSEEIACVLAHAFFWWIPVAPLEFDMPSSINFTNWFSGKDQVYQEKIEKLMCYFKEVEREELLVQEGKAKVRRVSFERLNLSLEKSKTMNDKYFEKCTAPLTQVTIKTQGYVEDEDKALITDFANKYLGGGVMNRGFVQEEVLFVEYPELLMSTFIWARLQDYEAVSIVGPRKIGPYDDFMDLDKLNRIDRTFIAIDALNLYSFKDQIGQFYEKDTLRELKKAFVGFKGDSKEEAKGTPKAVSTGRWGWGAFNGNAELKFLIQWIAWSILKRDMIFHTFEHIDWEKLKQVMLIYTGQKVSDVYWDLKEFRRHLTKLEREDKVYISKAKLRYLLSDFLLEKYKI